MTDNHWLAQRFEENRGHLRAVAYRMLGSTAEADDAIQETWLRLSRSDANTIENLPGWLTTVIARVCLDMLRSRKTRAEDELDLEVPRYPPAQKAPNDPEREAVLADSVGLALLVVLDRLTPPERLAFVLHDIFAVPFEEIAEIVGRSPEATRQLASRARRRVQGPTPAETAKLSEQRKTINAFLTALRAGDVQGLVAVLDPEVLVNGGAAGPVRGAEAWAKQARAYAHGVRFVQPALIDGKVGAILAPGGKLSRALVLTFKNGKIAQIDVIADSAQLAAMEFSVLPAE